MLKELKRNMDKELKRKKKKKKRKMLYEQNENINKRIKKNQTKIL